MALPLKSGADLYNNQALRLRLHNLGADPTEVGAGLIYFNTSTGLNTSQKARIYTGNAWKTIAFSEDLDVASNADFLALKDRVDLLSGEVDTDAIISNMKEVSAFLEGFVEDASLMDYLNTELGKKLNKSGGTISGNLTIGGDLDIAGYIKSSSHYLFVRNNDGADWVVTNKNWSKEYTLLHSGNYSDYALPLTGGTMTGNLAVSSGTISSLRTSTRRAVFYKNASESVDSGTYIVDVSDSGDAVLKLTYNDLTWKGNTLLHSGNVGDYAVKGLNIQTSSDNTRNLFSVWRGNTDADGGDGYVMDFNWNSGNYKAQIYIDVDPTHKMALRQCGNDAIWTDWKTIAFTDSDITGTAAKAKSLVDTADNAVAYVSGNTFYIGDSIYPTTSTQILGKDIRLRYGANASFGFWLNESGNVTIGDQDLAGDYHKLYVSGHSGFVGNIDIYSGGRIQTYSNPLIINNLGNNVGIGTTNPQAKLDVNGDVHVTGNLIVEGEVSAGGAGTEGGGSSSGGGGAFHSESIGVGATQTTIAHGLGTDDIVVSIYEKDGVSGRWSIILTDVEIVDANNIIVSFGSATTVEHKVVIMGAVA